MIDACDEHGVKLMIAYRLHFEEINLKAVDLVRRGRIVQSVLRWMLVCFAVDPTPGV